MIFRILFVLLPLIVAFTDACTCNYQIFPTNKTLENYVCDYDVVLRATIHPLNISEITIDGSVSYHDQINEIRNISVFRNIHNVTVPTIVVTPSDGGLCGQNFGWDKEYLIFGTLSKDRTVIRTGLCDHNTQWEYLDVYEIDGLESGRFAGACEPNESKGKRAN